MCVCAMEENREGEVIRNRYKARNRKKDKEWAGKSERDIESLKEIEKVVKKESK